MPRKVSSSPGRALRNRNRGGVGDEGSSKAAPKLDIDALLRAPDTLLGKAGSYLQPQRPDMKEFLSKDMRGRMQAACENWALYGFGVPRVVHLLYFVKMWGYLQVFWSYCLTHPAADAAPAYDAAAAAAEAAAPFDGTPLEGAAHWGLGHAHDVLSMRSSAWYEDAFKRFVVYNMLFEVLGFGCGSGPLTLRFIPPVSAFVHWLWPGSHKLPSHFWRRSPFGLLKCKRTVVDVALFVAYLYFMVAALRAPQVGPDEVLPIVIILPIIGLLDRAIFLAARSEHYLSMMVCFLFPSHWIVGCQVVQIGIWTWAGVSKLGPWFPHVIGVMISNSPNPLFGSQWLRRKLYRDVPNDMRPSRLGVALAHFGTASEMTFPLVMAFGGHYVHPVLPLVGLVVCLGFHIFITSNFAMGVPQEWNLFNMTSAIFLFGRYHSGGGSMDIASLATMPPVLALVLALVEFVVPIVGNIRPRMSSFLLAMRYYAGNWPVSVFIYRASAAHKWNDRVLKGRSVSKLAGNQLMTIWAPVVALNLMYRVMAFRAMHLHGRLLPSVLRMALRDSDKGVKKGQESLDGWQYADGEMIAGVALGYNFGDGKLHDDLLLREVIQPYAKFERGECYHLVIRSAGIFNHVMPWALRDASAPHEVVASGSAKVDELLEMQPF